MVYFKIYNQMSTSSKLIIPDKLFSFKCSVIDYINNEDNQGRILLFPDSKCKNYKHFPIDKVKFIGITDSCIQDHPFDKRFRIRWAIIYTTCGRCFYAYVIWYDNLIGESFEEIKEKYEPISHVEDDISIYSILNNKIENSFDDNLCGVNKGAIDKYCDNWANKCRKTFLSYSNDLIKSNIEFTNGAERIIFKKIEKEYLRKKDEILLQSKKREEDIYIIINSKNDEIKRLQESLQEKDLKLFNKCKTIKYLKQENLSLANDKNKLIQYVKVLTGIVDENNKNSVKDITESKKKVIDLEELKDDMSPRKKPRFAYR